MQYKKITFIIIVIIIGLAIFGLIIVLRPRSTGQSSSISNSTLLSPTSEVSFPQKAENSFIRDPRLDTFALKDAPPSSSPLTQQEQIYPTGIPQKFPNTRTTQTGMLLVTSDIGNVRIIITTSDPGDANIGGQRQYDSPANIAPVRFILPANYYTVVAEKDQYIWKWIPVVVEPNKVTRLQVHLDPANLVQ